MKHSLQLFTSEQASRARVVIQQLVLERRFFLSDPLGGGGYARSPHVFGSLMEIDDQLQLAYKQAREVAEGYIRQVESNIGFAPPNLDRHNSIVQCNRYGGGLDICTAWPLARFSSYVPSNFTELLSEVAQLDTGTPSAVRFGDLANIIWRQLNEMEAGNPANDRIIVLMKTRFVPDRCDDNDDLMDGKLLDLQSFPHALGYLLHKASCDQHLTNKTLDLVVLCSTDSRSHVVLFHHARSDKPRICFDKSTTYPYVVHFATIL